MVILDTDHMSLLQRGNAEGERIRRHLRILPPDDIATTIVSYEEQMRGWLAQIARGTALEGQISDYAEIKKMLRNYCNIAVVDFGVEAAYELRQLQTAKIRVGTMDLKIAAIALANKAILLTRNMTHFHRIPGLQAEDWSL